MRTRWVSLVMSRYRSWPLTVLVLAAVASSPGVLAAMGELAPLVPVEDFFRKPAKTAFAISPNGEYLAWLEPWSRRLNLFVQKIGEENVQQLTYVTDRDIQRFFWESDEELIFTRDAAGEEHYHLFGVRREGGEIRDLTPYPGVVAMVLDDLEDQPDRVLILTNQRDRRVFDVYRLTPSTGKVELVAQNPGNIGAWLADHQGRIRAAYAEEGLDRKLLYRDSEQGEFRTLVATDFRTTVYPIAFTFDNRRLYLLSNAGRDKEALVELDPTDAKEHALYEHPDVDVAEVLLSKHRKRLEGVGFVTDRLEYAFFDRNREHTQRFLESRLPGRQVTVVDWSKDEGRLIVWASSDLDPGAYYLYENDIQKLDKLADTAPQLRREDLAPMQAIRFTARDGRIIAGYLTLPLGAGAKHLPVIVNPHGGPDARDVWGYLGEAQFLANRGYAVLQVNFRGSTGYGRNFWQAGFRQWGRGAMQHDLTDGARWLVDRGVADPKRIAIYGGSYGGYAALAGLAFTPEIYAAGVSLVGPSNLFTFFSSIPPYWELGRKEWYEKVGDPDKDREFLTSISPYFHAEQIRAPLLVVQGANDPRVNKAESDQIVGALRRRGIRVPYLLQTEEGHGFRQEENRLEFYRILEAFLAKHLGGRTTTDPSVLAPLEQAK